MDELVFFAVIIFFSIIESIARSRRQKQKQREGEASGEGLPELPDPSEWEARLPEPGRREAEARAPSPRSSSGATSPHSGATRPSSEEMLPGDLLEELSRMAGRLQEREARTINIPRESPPLPEPVEERPTRGRDSGRSRLPVRSSLRTVPGRRPEHRVHAAHAEYGTDPSSRKRSFHDTLDPLAERLSDDARAVRNQLRSKKSGALRQAFILREVLGEPLAFRE